MINNQGLINPIQCWVLVVQPKRRQSHSQRNPKKDQIESKRPALDFNVSSPFSLRKVLWYHLTRVTKVLILTVLFSLFLHDSYCLITFSVLWCTLFDWGPFNFAHTCFVYEMISLHRSSQIEFMLSLQTTFAMSEN